MLGALGALVPGEASSHPNLRPPIASSLGSFPAVTCTFNSMLPQLLIDMLMNVLFETGNMISQGIGITRHVRRTGCGMMVRNRVFIVTRQPRAAKPSLTDYSVSNPARITCRTPL
jgi:hypothetical protein